MNRYFFRPCIEALEDRQMMSSSPLTAGSLTPPQATEGKQVPSSVIFHFTDSAPKVTAGDFQATVQTGDGTRLTNLVNPQNVQVVANPRGGFDVRLSNYTYPDELNNAVFAVFVQDSKGDLVSRSGKVSVADAPLQLTLANPRLTQGPNTNVVVATFTQAVPNPNIFAYQAVIHWGDGSVSTASAAAGTIVQNANGSFSILGSHTYYNAGTQASSFLVQVTDTGGAQASRTASVSVAVAPLTAGALTPPQAAKGYAFSGVVVFHFTDANPAPRASYYTATIRTGDGTTLLSSANPQNVQVVANPQGGFDVLLSYTYARQLSGATFAVQVNDKGGASSGASTGTFTVAGSPLTAGALTPPQAVEGQALSRVIGFHFSDVNHVALASDFTATVQTGDGTTLTSSANPQNVQVVANPQGGFDVLLSYTYVEELINGTFAVLVSDKGGASTGASIGALTVADAPLTAGALTPPQAVEGQALSRVIVFHFGDGNPGAGASDFTATVQTGDGTMLTSSANPQNVQVVANPQGGFDVLLSCTYAEELVNGTFAVQISDKGGASTGASTGAFAVADAPLTAGNLTPPQVAALQSISKTVVFHFTDANPTAAASDFTATVQTGDGTTLTSSANLRNVQVVADPQGGFDVLFSYTYAAELANGAFAVQVSDKGGASTGASTAAFAVARVPVNVVNGTLGGVSVSFILRADGTLWETQGPQMIDTGVQSFQVVNGEVIDLHRDGTLESMNYDGSNKVILDSGALSFSIDSNGNVSEWNQDLYLHFFTVPTSASNPVFIQTGVERFAINGAGDAVELNQDGNLCEFTSRTDASQYVVLASGVKSFGINGAGDVVALTQNGNLCEFTAPASASSYVLLDSGVQSFAINAAGHVMDFDTNGNVYEFTAPASASSRITAGNGCFYFGDTGSVCFVGTTPVDSAGDDGIYILIISSDATGTVIYQGPNQVIAR